MNDQPYLNMQGTHLQNELPLITDTRDMTAEMLEELCNGCERGEVAND